MLKAQTQILVEKLKEIVRGCQKNNRQKQAELYQMFASKMFGLCLRYAGNQFDAQDLMQEGFVKVFEHIRKYKWKGSLEGWMKRIFINLALDKYRSRINHLSVEEIQENNDLENREASALDNISEREILELIKQLPDQYRLVFNLYVIEGHSHQEIGKILNIGESTSRSNLARAKLLLKEKLIFNATWVEKAI